MTLGLLHPGHRVELLEGGAQYFAALLQAIASSRVQVRLETYIFEFDASGRQVAGALEAAAQRGVEVLVVMDGIGTPSVPFEWQQRWDAAGVAWQQFSPLGRLGLLLPTTWRRMHRKLCVVDGQLAFCGGINILDDFNDPNHGPLPTARFDFAVQVHGPLVDEVQQTMAQFWRRLQLAHQLERLNWRAARAVLKNKEALGVALGVAPSAERVSPGALVKAGLLVRDNVKHRTRIERAYRQAIAHAKQEVLIANAYFLPGRKLRKAMIYAARRGVRVRLLLQGRYEYFMQFHACRLVYGGLLAAGVEIYEYHSGFLHAKVAVVDGVWATVGSSNLDPLSLLLAREANVVVQDAVFAQRLQQCLEQAMQQHAQQLHLAAYENRPLRQRLLDRLAFAAVRVGLFLTGKRY